MTRGGRWLGLVAIVTVLAGCFAPSPTAGRWQVRIDEEPWEVLLARADGMRGLADFDGADGMLFDFDQDIRPNAVFFVMDGVAFPLDIAWFRDDGALVGTASMPVCPAEPCPRHAAPDRFRWAIEAPVGTFADLAPDARLVVGTD